MATKDDRLNTLSPAAVPPQILRIPPRTQMGPPAGTGIAEFNAIGNAFNNAGGGAQGAGAATREAGYQFLVKPPMDIGRAVTNYTTNLYGPPARLMAQFGKGLVGMTDQPTTPATPPVAQPAAAPAAVTPTTQTTTPPAALPSTPDYWNADQASKTRAVLNNPQAAPAATSNYTMDNVPQGGGYMSWGGAMGKDTMAQIDPSHRGQFQQPGSLSITPDQASALAKRVQIVPAASFHRPMASSDQAVAEARMAAADRGDFEGIRRSYLTPEQRQAENEQRDAAMADRAEQQRLEAMATQAVSPSMPWGQMMTTAGNRRFARDRLQQMAAERVQNAKIASDDKQQAFANQIALANAQANQTRATAAQTKALNRPGQSQVMQWNETDPKTLAVTHRMALVNKETGEITPLDQSATPAISEEQINATMAATGMTRDAVMAELKARGMVQ